MLTESATYLRNATDWERTVVIGGVLGFFSFLLIPAFVVMGYLLRVLRATIRGPDERPPTFDEWGDMAIDGLKASLITVVYALVPGIIISAIFGFGFAGLVSGTDVGAVTGSLLLLVGSLVAIVLGLAMAYVVPAAILNYAEKGSLSAGFAFGDIYPMLGNRAYMMAFAYTVTLFIAVGVVAGLLNAVPFLGAVASAFVGFYAAVMAAYIYGTTYAEMYPAEVTGTNTVDEQVPV